MSKYRMEDGTFADTTKAVANWKEATEWDGNNHISKATGSQWVHEELFKSSKGRYYVEHWSQWQGSTPDATWATDKEAAQWLLDNEHELPDDLAALEAALCE